MDARDGSRGAQWVEETEGRQKERRTQLVLGDSEGN